MAQCNFWDTPGFGYRTVTIVLYINDLPELTKSDTFTFADDIKIFRTITDKNDQGTLQDDLNTLEQWSKKWLLKCNPSKCKHMTIGNNNIGEIKYSMTLNNSIYPLDTIENQNDLGVIIDTKLSFDDHIKQAVNKATKMKTIIRRAFQFHDKDTHLDYAIENVQRRATTDLPGMRNLTYIERLKLL